MGFPIYVCTGVFLFITSKTRRDSLNISELVSKTVSSGVAPMRLTYKAVRNCRSFNAVAYRASIEINSLEFGTLTENEFWEVAEKNDAGNRLCDWAIKEIVSHREKFENASRHPAWISIRCPVAYVEREDFYEHVRSLAGRCEQDDIKICLEFSEKLLYLGDKAKQAMLDLKLIGVNSMIVCDNADTCPFFRLSEIPVDLVLLSVGMTKTVSDKNKPATMSSLIQFLRSLGIDAVANSVPDTEERLNLARAECVGYVSEHEESVSLEDAIAQKEDDN